MYNSGGADVEFAAPVASADFAGIFGAAAVVV
jgi:hypothetical protein